MATERQRKGAVLAALAGALCCLWVFYSIRGLYGNYRIEYGVGVGVVPESELIFYLWFAMCCGAAMFFLWAALTAAPIPRIVRSLFARLAADPTRTVAVAVLVLLVLVLLVQETVLLRAPICDDESTYRFIAQTLTKGRITNPSPGDIGFFKNQFVILDATSWWGKYPIGHPLALAVGELVGARHLIVPLITCGCFIVTFLVGRKAFDPRTSLFGTLLLLVSPQFVMSGGTQLSQPTSCLCMLLGALCILLLREDRRFRWAFLGGVALGYGVLVRPMPGILFAVCGAMFLLADRSCPLRRRLGLLVAGGIPLVLFGVLMLLVNKQQTGQFLSSGYQAWHGSYSLGTSQGASFSGSLAGNLVRENFWLLGWPIGFVFLPFARGRAIGLVVGLVACALLYRVLAPKTVVGNTGPVYLYETVPLLCLLTAAGARRLGAILTEHGFATGRKMSYAFVAASSLVGLVGFVPVQIENNRRSSRIWQRPNDLIAAARAEPALVFADFMVDPTLRQSWAYYPPPPDPSLDEPTIFVREAHGPSGAKLSYEFWKRRFPDRRAFVYQFIAGAPRFREVRGEKDFDAPAR